MTTTGRLGLGISAGLALALLGAPVASWAEHDGYLNGGCASELVYFGTQGSGSGQGIFAARFDPSRGRLSPLGLAADIDRPTWIVRDPARPIVYSVSEIGNRDATEASVSAFRADRETGRLQLLDMVDSGGRGATFLALDTPSQTLFVANFGSGQVSALPVEPDGSLGAPASVQSDYGAGPNPRQAGPHAHAVAVDPSGRFIVVADFGADRLFVYRFDRASRQLTRADPPFEPLPPASGPRHLVFHPNRPYLFVVTELSAEVRSYRWNPDTGRLQLIQTLSTVAPDYRGKKGAAEILIGPEGHHLYVSNRGENSIVVYSIDSAAGALREVQRLGSQGDTPWSFSIDPTGRWMLVANEGSNLVSVLKRDPTTGMLSPGQEAIAVPQPVRVLFWGSARASGARSRR